MTRAGTGIHAATGAPSGHALSSRLRWPLALLICLFAWACSHTTSQYLQPGYDSTATDAIKRIGIDGWADGQRAAGLGPVLALVATDYIKLRKNYLVHPHDEQPTSWETLCQKNLDGVLWVRAMEVTTQGQQVRLRLAAELYACKTGALVWRAEGERNVASESSDLSQLVDNYSQTLGNAAKTYAAPAFVLLQELLSTLPDPTLNDHDIEEKIELGSL